jgi:hypothetical protein
MSTLRLLSAAALLTVAASAHASSFIATTDAIVGTLKATTDLTSDATELHPRQQNRARRP